MDTHAADKAARECCAAQRVLNTLVIYGASGHAAVVAETVRLEERFGIVGFLDDVNIERHGSDFLGATVLGGGEQLRRLHGSGVRYALVAIGDNNARMMLAHTVVQAGFQLATAIHPSASVARGVVLGRGTVVMSGAIINPLAVIGDNVVINTGAIVEHGCCIADGATIGPRACLGGDCVVGQGAWIGIGAVVREKLEIGAGAIVGAGAVVVRAVPPRVVVWGVPARVIRNVVN